MQHKIKSCPAWLGISEDRLSFVFYEDRAAVVKAIYEDALSGIGADVIVRRLIQRNVKPFGLLAWQQSTISKLLTNRAVLGEFQRNVSSGRKYTPIGEPIPNYYPPVIEKALFEAVQEARKQNFRLNRGGKGVNLSNLFVGIIHCAYCGSRMKVENITASSNPTLAGQYFVCNKAFVTRDCISVRWSPHSFEDAFFAGLERISALSGILETELQPALTAFRAPEGEDNYKRRSAIAHETKRVVSKVCVATAGFELKEPLPQSRSANVTYAPKSRCMKFKFVCGDQFVYHPHGDTLELI
jgi:hypothetical protein